MARLPRKPEQPASYVMDYGLHRREHYLMVADPGNTTWGWRLAAVRPDPDCPACQFQARTDAVNAARVRHTAELRRERERRES